MNPIYEKLEKCYQCVREKTDFVPEVAIILGSGFGQFADEFEEVKKISYHEIEGFPVSTVQGHAGEFIFGYMQDVPVVLMNGRVHYYEGYAMSDVVLPTRLMKMLGAKILFLTNAAGGLGDGFAAGDIMMITDQSSVKSRIFDKILIYRCGNSGNISDMLHHSSNGDRCHNKNCGNVKFADLERWKSDPFCTCDRSKI